MAETIYSPVEGYSGTVAGVVFDDGKAETDDEAALAYFRRHGYGIGSPPEAEETEPTEPPEPVVTTTTLRDAASPDTPEEPVKPEGGTEPQPEGDVEAHPNVELPSVEQPNRSASKADWVDYAVSQGASRDDADDMTRDDLIEAYG